MQLLYKLLEEKYHFRSKRKASSGPISSPPTFGPPAPEGGTTAHLTFPLSLLARARPVSASDARTNDASPLCCYTILLAAGKGEISLLFFPVLLRRGGKWASAGQRKRNGGRKGEKEIACFSGQRSVYAKGCRFLLTS